MALIAGVVLLALAVLGGGAVLLSGQRAASTTATPAGASAGAPSTANAAAVAEASSEYRAAIAPLNADLAKFSTALQVAASQPCRCPAGEFDATVPFRMVPGIVQDYGNVIATLGRLKQTVPQFSSDIDAVVYDNKLRSASFAAGYQAFNANQQAAAVADIDATTDEENAALPAINQLRADFGLPPLK